MKKIILVQIFIGCTVASFCQTGKLRGMIYDSTTKLPLELATVSVFQEDSSLISYQLSDKNGIVSFDKLPLKKSLLVSVSFVGYKTYFSRLPFTGRDTLKVFLSLSTNDTSSVIVNSTIPVRMNGDTLEINPAAFKMQKHQVVEELLNQVPGITIWSDGSITVGGRKVQNLFVDGKPFVGSTDPRIATQNLPKSAIDKIQLYQEYDRANLGTAGRQPTDSVLTMNIKLKESAKTGYFGKGGMGYGTDDRAESDLILQVYNKKSSGGFGGGYNNINKDIGSVSQLLQNNTYRTTNPDLYRVGRFGANGINKSHSIGGLLTHNFNESNNSRQNNRITVNYTQNGTDSWVTNTRRQDRIGLGLEQIIRDESQQNSRSNRHAFDINYTKTNSYNDNLYISASAASQDREGTSSLYTEISDVHGSLQSTNQAFNRQTEKSGNRSLTLNYGKHDFDQPLANINLTGSIQHSYSSSERDVVSVFRSMTINSKDTSYNRHYVNDNESLSAQASISYDGIKRLLFGRYNLAGINLSFVQGLNYDRSTNNSVVTDFDSSSKKHLANKNLTNNNEKIAAGYTPTLSVSKNISRSRSGGHANFNLQARLIGDFKVEKNASSITQRNLDRSFKFFRYETGISFFIRNKKQHNYNASLNYRKSFDYPSIDALYTIVDDINLYNITIGNPHLKNRTIHNVSIFTTFNTQNPQSPYSVNFTVNGSYNRSYNPVADSVINFSSGKRISYYINADQNTYRNVNYTFNLSKRIKKNSIQLSVNGSYNSGQQPNYIDGVYNLSKNSRISNQVSLRYSLASILSIGITERLERNWVKQTISTFNNFKNNSSTTNVNVNLNYPQNFSFGSTLDYIKTATLDKPTVLLNAFATHRLLNQQAELKVSAMDILKQYVNIAASANAYGTSISVSNGLQQYFMLTFAYYPRKFGKKAGASGGENMSYEIIR
jgi:hypothetical protein